MNNISCQKMYLVTISRCKVAPVSQSSQTLQAGTFTQKKNYIKVQVYVIKMTPVNLAFYIIIFDELLSL